MSSQTTETSSDEDSNFIVTESSTMDNNSQPVLLKNPFYYKTENVSETMESCSSIFDHKTDSDSDDSVISQIEETMSDSLDNKIEMDNSQHTRGNEIVLKNFPGRITIKYSPRTPEKSDNKIGRISKERGVQTDRTRDNLNDRATVKEEPQSQNNEMIKEEENEAINNGANEDSLHYRNTKEENHSQVLEEVDEEDEKVSIPEVQSRDDVDELNEEEEESNVFQIEVTLVEMDVEASQDDIKIEQSTNEYNENRLETPEFHGEMKNEIKTDRSSQNASEAGASSPGINVEGAHAEAITIMDVEAPHDDTTNIREEHSTNENYLNRLKTPEFHEEVKNEIKTDASSQNALEADAASPGINVKGARADVITTMDVEVPQDDTTVIKAEHSTNENHVNRSETPEFHEEVKHEIKTNSISQNSADVDVSSRRINVQVARENVIIIMDMEAPQDDTTDDIKVEHSTNDNNVDPSETSEFHEGVKNEIKTDSSSSNASEAGVLSPRMNVKVSRQNVITSNFQNEVHLQRVQGDDSNHEEKPNVKLEDVREKSIPQNPEDYAVPRSVDGSAQANVDINVKFGEMEFEEAQEEPGNRYDAGAGGDNNHLKMNISGVDMPQVPMEVEELQGQLSNDENNRNLCNEEQSIVQEQMPVVDKPRIYVKSRTQLFPEGYRSLNSTQEEISQIPSDFVHNEKKNEAEPQRLDDSSDDEWLKSESARVEARANKEPPKPPDESQDLVRRRGIRTKILPQPPQQPIADPLNDEAVIKTERPPPPCLSEAETVILPWKLEKATQVSPQARGKRVTQSNDSALNETSAATDTSQQTEKKERIVYSLASKFYRGKPFSPQEDRIIVDFVVSHYGKDRSLPRDVWEALTRKPEIRHRTTRSLENRYERYLRGRSQYYVKDPEIRKWFANPTRKKKQAPSGTLKNHRSSDDDSEDEL